MLLSLKALTHAALDLQAHNNIAIAFCFLDTNATSVPLNLEFSALQPPLGVPSLVFSYCFFAKLRKIVQIYKADFNKSVTFSPLLLFLPSDHRVDKRDGRFWILWQRCHQSGYLTYRCRSGSIPRHPCPSDYQANGRPICIDYIAKSLLSTKNR